MSRSLTVTVLLCILGFAGPTHAATPFVLETVDASGLVAHPSLVVDQHGNPHIVYFNYTGNLLRYASRLSGVWTIETIGDFGQEQEEVESSSLVLDAQDNPHISFQLSSHAVDLEYATRSGGVWSIEPVDTDGDVGSHNSIAIDPQGNPGISYWDSQFTAGALKYASKNAGTWTLDTVVTIAAPGRATSLSFDTNGNPCIAYYDQSTGALKYATGAFGTWAIEVADPNADLPGNTGSQVSLALDAQGNPHICYYDMIHKDLKLAGRTGGTWSTETVKAAVNLTAGSRAHVSLALDAQDNPNISFYDGTNAALMYAKKSLGNWTIEAVDTGVNGNYDLSIAIDGQDQPCIAYIQRIITNQSALRYAGIAQAPVCSFAVASEPMLWPPNHSYRAISILGVTDPDGDPVTITVTGITQDEPLNTRGEGNTCPDGQIVGGQGVVRAERTGSPGTPGNGRVYVIAFTATDGTGQECEGSVSVCVPTDPSAGATCIDDGQKYNSLGACGSGSSLSHEIATVSLTVGRLTETQASLEFTLPRETWVELNVFDLTGRLVKSIENGTLPPGVYQRIWDMGGVGRGLYFARLRAAGVTSTTPVTKLH